MAQPGFFDLDNRYESLSHMGDPLEVLGRSVPWETFRPVLSKALRKFKKSNAGRRPYDSVLMFKILVLQSLYNLSDDQTEFQIKDRLSFMRFLGMDFEDSVPDAKTLWLFRDTLANKGAIDKLIYRKFNRYTSIAKASSPVQGQLIDASLVPATCSAQHSRRKRPNQTGRSSRELGERTSQTSAKRHRCPLGKNAGSQPLWLQEPRQCRPQA